MTLRPDGPFDRPHMAGGDPTARPKDDDRLATPEGDNEDLPSEPLSGTEPVPLRPRGDEPHSSEPLRPALDLNTEGSQRDDS